MIITKSELFQQLKSKKNVTMIDGCFKVGSKDFIDYLNLALDQDDELVCNAYDIDCEFAYIGSTSIAKGRKLELKSVHSYCVIIDGAWLDRQGKKGFRPTKQRYACIISNFLNLGVLNT